MSNQTLEMPVSCPRADCLDWQVFTRAQSMWGQTPLPDRLIPLSKLRGLLIDRSQLLFNQLDERNTRSSAEFVSSELIALAEAAKWHQKNAGRVLRSRTLRHWGLNPFLGRMKGEVLREPLGKIVIIGTWNYPVFLTGVQILQALVAGNAVLLKPAPKTEPITRELVRCFVDSGYDAELMQVLSAESSEVDACLSRGIDLIIMTGSSRTGRMVATKASGHLVPMIAELSGCDAMFVLPDADLDRVASAIAFGARVNQGSTCMAPRRVIISNENADRLVPLLKSKLPSLPTAPLRSETSAVIDSLVQNALGAGANLIYPESLASAPTSFANHSVSAIVLDGVTSDMDLARRDYFAPVVSILRQSSSDLDDWIACNERCPYALNATVFGDPATAKRLAKRINASIVTINDIFVPTVEPSLSFGGRKESGFGVTRGEEGLRQLTREKSIVVRQGNFLPHLQGPQPNDDVLVSGLFDWLHGQSIRKRFGGIMRMIKAVKSQSLSKSEKE